jgi:hypothetical protein
MNWLKDHVYVAAWLSPLLALIGMIAANLAHGTTRTNWSLVMIYVGFLTCMAVVFTPLMDSDTRIFAGVCFVGLGFFIGVHAASEDEK